MTNDNMITLVKECMELQDTFNKVVNKNWINAGYPFSRAAWMEMAEAMGPTNWKWWKQQQDDRFQTTLEMVDIFHFMLSDAIIKHQTAEMVVNSWVFAENKFPANRVNDIQYALTQAERFISSACDDKLFWPELFNVMLSLDINLSTVLELYIKKNCLNAFRQANGYKAGSYIKEWFGEEDNKVLERIVQNSPGMSYSDLYEALSKEYSKVILESKQ